MTGDTAVKGRRRCFLLVAEGSDAATITALLDGLGVDCTWTGEIPGGTPIGLSLLHGLAAADVVIALWTSRSSSNAALELGIAFGLGKPILVLGIGVERAHLPTLLDLRGINVLMVKDLERLAELTPDIVRFLRYAKGQSPISAEAPASRPGDFSWARDRLASIRTMEGGLRGLAFEDLVFGIFNRAGAEVVRTRREGEEGDLVVWLNDIAYEFGGPLLVECKRYGGGSGSVIKNVESTIMRLDKLIDDSDASLALLVFDHDRPKATPVIRETPRALALAVETLIDQLEDGTLAKELLIRRQHAAVSRGTISGIP